MKEEAGTVLSVWTKCYGGGVNEHNDNNRNKSHSMMWMPYWLCAEWFCGCGAVNNNLRKLNMQNASGGNGMVSVVGAGAVEGGGAGVCVSALEQLMGINWKS